MRTIWQWLINAFKTQKSLYLLRQLDDRQLQDIGLSQWQIAEKEKKL